MNLALEKIMFNKFYSLSVCFVLCCAFLLSSCAKQVPPPENKFLVSKQENEKYFLSHLNPRNQNISSWRMLEPTLRKSLSYVKVKKSEDIAVDRPGLRLTWGQMEYTLVSLLNLLPQLDRNPNLFQEKFVWVPVHGGMKYSAYYEPVLKASRTYKPGYTPLYKKPSDLDRYRKNGRKYHSRTAIDKENVLAGRGFELAWAESFVDVYYLQIQGSGKLAFDDGSSAYVNYAGQNGHDYVSSGRIMREKGLLKRGDVQEQKQWFKDNPDRIWEIFKENPSYVFFRFGDKGATGAMGRVVDPLASIATDRHFIPLGSVVAYGVNVPRKIGGPKALRAIGFAQDVGGAIKRNRVDIFAGGGAEAEYMASYLDAPGPAWVLVSKEVF